MPLPLPPALKPLLAAGAALVPETEAVLGNPSFEEAEARILVVRLSPWRDVDRSTSHLILFAECRKALPRAYLDFAFMPDRGDRELLVGAARGGGTPPWFYGLASGRSPADFDLVLVSNAFALELLNLPYLFSTSGLPLRASARAALGARRPLVVLGGSNAAAAGAIVGEAGADGSRDAMADGLFFGEGEGAIGELALALTAPGVSPDGRLARAEAVEGFWRAGAPPRGGGTRRRLLGASPEPLLEWPLLNSPESGTARLQIAAGCPGLCSFCFEGWDRRPYRERPLAHIIADAREIRRRQGADSLEVYSFNFNTHEEVFALLFELGRIFRRVSFMSQRLDVLASTPGLVRAELAADKRSLTLGIEGVSARMRAYYRKGLSDEELGRLVELLVAPGIRELKLFYIVSGLEEDADLEEFAAFARLLGEARSERAPGLRILASAGYLVRLPWTPLQSAPLALEEAPLARIAGALREACEASGLEFRLASYFDEYCADQLLVLGGPPLLSWLEAAPSRGLVYDGSLSRGAWPSLRAAAEAAGLLGAEFLSEKGEGWRPPLPFLDPGRDSDLLRAEYLEARAGRDRPACLGEGCRDCGACEDAGARAFIARHRVAPPAEGLIDRITRLTAAKAAFRPVYAEVDLPAGLSGSTEAYKGAYVLKELGRLVPGSEQSVFEAREALFCRGGAFGLGEGFSGKTVFALYGPRPSRVAEIAAAAGFAVLPAGPDRGAPALLRIEAEVGFPPGGTESGRILASFREWLAEARIACTESRRGSARVFTVAAKDLRKGYLLAAELEEGPEGFIARLGLGPKARLEAWLSRLGPLGTRAARVRVVSLAYAPGEAGARLAGD